VLANDPEAHIRRVTWGLQAGHKVLVGLRDRGDWETWDIEETQLDLNQTTLPLPQDDDPFFIATDERDPDALENFVAAGAVFLSDLLTEDDRQTFGWPLMFTDLAAVVEAAGARPRRLFLRALRELVRRRYREYAREPWCRPTDLASGLIVVNFRVVYLHESPANRG
jgi:hypothetical protein